VSADAKHRAPEQLAQNCRTGRRIIGATGRSLSRDEAVLGGEQSGIRRIFKPWVAELGGSLQGQTGSDDENETRSGRALRFDPQTEQVIGDDEASKLSRDSDRGYRSLFVVPEEV
jgi:hypothetical protein